MKTFYLILLLMGIVSCNSDKQKNENQFIDFIDFESFESDSSLKDNFLKDSLSNLIPPARVIILDSIKYHIVEGDLLMNDYEFNQHQIYKSIKVDTAESRPKLVAEKRDNKIVKWNDDYVLNYCISKNSFRTIEQYETVKRNMKLATDEWEKTCNIKFYHDESKDHTNILSPTKNLTFVVLGYDTNGAFVASAFFPYYAKKRRRILIDPTYFKTSFDKTGVLRHELGHTLGFRHEHIRSSAPIICQGENTDNTTNVTRYDPNSVMHYFCGGMGNINLEITEIDKKGSQSIYGRPKTK